LDNVLDSIDLQSSLTSAISGVIGGAMQEQADYDANALEDEIAERVGGDIEADLSFDVRDTAAFELIQRRAASDMVTVEDTVKRRIRRTMTEVAEGSHPVVEDYVEGGNVGDATQALREEVDELSDSHARLVARTETLTASRHGSQSLGESSDLIEGKQWDATGDTRTRSWHAAMDGEIVDVNSDFVVPDVNTDDGEYQPSDYPRAAFVVGDDQPFNCRCSQRHVLSEDMPEAKRALATIEGVTIYENGVEVEGLTSRQMELWREWAGTSGGIRFGRRIVGGSCVGSWG